MVTPQIERLKMRRVSQLVAAELRSMILHGQFNGLDRLPPERDLEEEFGISKHHFREALRLLEQDGLVSVRPGRNGGVFLTTPTVDVLTRTFSGMLARKGTKLRDVMQARLVIEPAAASLAAQEATEQEIEELIQVVDRQEAEGVYESNWNRRFHIALTAGAHNETLLLMMRSIESIIESIDIGAQNTSDRISVVVDSVKAHRSILRALQQRDAEKVAMRVRQHILGWESRLTNTGLDPETYSIADVLQQAEASVRR